MSFEASTYQVEQLISTKFLEIGDGYRAKNSELSSTGIPFARAANINDGFKFNDPDFFPEADLAKVGNKISKPGDVVFTSKGTVGRFALVGANTPRFVYSPQLCFWRSLDQEKLLPEYLYYWMNSQEFLNQIGYLKGQTDMADYVSLRDQRKITATIPSTDVQQLVVAVLKPIDDRIALLRETNTTLEAIAQALFKSWFVDFDPVRAKQQGREPEGMDAETAALFPNSFEESELGLVPSGWEVSFVKDVTEIIKGKSYSSKDLADNHDTALVSLKSFERSGGFRLDGFKPYTGSYKPSQVVVPGDLIIAYTDVTQAAELIGKPAIVVGVAEYQTLVASLDVGILRPDIEKVSRQFLYGLCKTESFQSHTFAHTSGTTVLHLAKDGVGSFQFVLPPIELILSFSAIAESLSERRQINIDQIRNLATLRDTLLPRLISGQLRLPNAAGMVAETLTGI